MDRHEVRAIRERLGLTQEELSAEITRLSGRPVSRVTIGRIERGERGVNPFLAAYLVLRERGATPDQALKLWILGADPDGTLSADVPLWLPRMAVRAQLATSAEGRWTLTAAGQAMRRRLLA